MGYGRVNLELIFVGRSNVGKSSIFSSLFGVKVRKGKKPGTTIKPNHFIYKDFLATDLPGFGYVSGVGREFNERIKDFIVEYVERNAKRIFAAVHVIDSKSFFEIVSRWNKRGFIPIDVEIPDFLRDVGIEVIIAANKIDKVKDEKEILRKISEVTKTDTVVPTIGKRGEVSLLKKKLKEILLRYNRADLLKVFK